MLSTRSASAYFRTYGTRLGCRLFDALHDEKAADPRHPRVDISMDGFSVFGLTAAQYSCWPIFVIPLNPPGQIMQRKNIFLTLIIPRPNYMGKNMNVYMQLLKDELHRR